MSTQFSKLKAGDILSETSFYKVQGVSGDIATVVPDSNNEPVQIGRKYVELMLISANQFDKEEKITRTELAEKFIGAVNTAFEICFYKKVKEADVVKEVMDAYESSAPKEIEKNVKKAIKKGLEGEQRILRGYHYGVRNEFGYIHVTDMDLAKDTTKPTDIRGRLVDPRTIEYLILRGVKYSAK